MNIAICEDEKYAAEQLKTLIGEVLSEKNMPGDIDIYHSGESFLSSGKSYDLIFLDCKLPGIDGVDAGIEFRRRNKKASIVFTSAYPEFAVRGYETSALRFLVKPISKISLMKTIESYIELHANECPVSFKDGTKEIVVSSADIIYIESLGKKSLVRLDGIDYETAKSLDAFEREISDLHFFRTHRRFIVNVSCVTEINGNMISMSNGESVEISMRKQSSFSKFYNSYLKKEF